MKRVVLTSSFAAIGYGAKADAGTFSETDWTDPSGSDVGAYVKSKTLTERAAWDFVSGQGGSLELSVVNPVGVFGPVLGPDYSTSILIVQRLMDGAMPGCPRLSFGIVDVRDVADLHLRAMTNPAARGERFLAVAGDFMTIPEIAHLLKERMGNAARRVPTRVLPDWIVRLVSLFDPSVALIVPELGKFKNADELPNPGACWVGAAVQRGRPSRHRRQLAAVAAAETVAHARQRSGLETLCRRRRLPHKAKRALLRQSRRAHIAARIEPRHIRTILGKALRAHLNNLAVLDFAQRRVSRMMGILIRVVARRVVTADHRPTRVAPNDLARCNVADWRRRKPHRPAPSRRAPVPAAWPFHPPAPGLRRPGRRSERDPLCPPDARPFNTCRQPFSLVHRSTATKALVRAETIRRSDTNSRNPGARPRRRPPAAPS